jgi:hypothetical protein
MGEEEQAQPNLGLPENKNEVIKWTEKREKIV